MRNRFLFILIIATLIVPVSMVSANETAAVWTRIYEGTPSLENKLSVMKSICELHDRDLAPMITDTLTELVYSKYQYSTTRDRQLISDLKRVMITELGNLKAVDATPVMFKVFEEEDNDFLKAIAIAGIGAAGGRDYADEIADYLRYINLDIIQIDNNEKRESLVGACIYSLERLKMPIGFEPVFYAAVGGYNRNTIAKAERALVNIMEDPSDELASIIRADTPYEIRYAALSVEERSNASAERKTEVASAALEVSLVYNAATPREREYQSRSKIKAAEMIRDLGVADDNAVQWLGRMLNSSTDVNELVTSLQALGTYTSDAAVEVLSKYLRDNNQRRSSGIQYNDERAIRECINALGNSGNPNARAELTMVEFSNWSSQTIRMAKNALKQLQQ